MKRANYDKHLETARRRLENRKRDLRKERARAAVGYAVKRGDMVRPDICPKCGRDDLLVEAHHEDYDRQLDVIWLCRACHRELHPWVGKN